ncbi:MAG: sensor histidine kinase [Chthoniobacter sp.]|uniref:sensor histidine kinase n=1 Tax=Chthoniobacter sp. TaxID=2510640 RepID=UPI0032AE07A9
MNRLTRFIEILGQQPPRRLMAEAIAFLFFVAGIDLLTTWQFSMYIFYCLPVYIVALYFSRRTALIFAMATVIIGTVASYDSIAVRGMGGYAWSAFNRLGGFLFAAACGIAFRSFREETQKAIEALRRTQQLEREIVRVGEREQQRIGQDLHDGVCQTLAALDCATQCLKLDLEADSSPRIGLATEIQRLLSAATLEARNMARGIYPVAISADSVAVAVQELAASMNRLFGGIIRVEADPEIALQDAETAVHLYRITQEALSNAIRHANATRITVKLSQHSQGLVMSVSDNGGGSAIQMRPEGMGSYTMRYRANLIGAELSVETTSGQGTEVKCTLPPVAVAA